MEHVGKCSPGEDRKERNMTQLQLAEILHISDKTVSKWERGESTPDPDVFLKLSQIFNVKIDYFLDRMSYIYQNKSAISIT